MWDLAAVQAARTLGKFRERDWIPKALNRLPLIKDHTARMQMSAALASAGCYDAWPIIYESLSSQRSESEALLLLPSFIRTKHSDGSEFDFEGLVKSLVPSMSEDLRKQAQFVLAEIRRRKPH